MKKKEQFILGALKNAGEGIAIEVKGFCSKNTTGSRRSGEHWRIAAGGDYLVTLRAQGRMEPEEQSLVRALTWQKPRASVSRQALFQAINYRKRTTAELDPGVWS